MSCRLENNDGKTAIDLALDPAVEHAEVVDWLIRRLEMHCPELLALGQEQHDQEM